MINVTEIAFTCYPVTDVARARRFYEGLLGLKASATFENEGVQWVEYDIGAATLAITNMGGHWKPSSAGPSLALEVSDFTAAVATVRAADVSFVSEPVDTGGCEIAILLDPDGNSLALHKRKPR